MWYAIVIYLHIPFIPLPIQQVEIIKLGDGKHGCARVAAQHAKDFIDTGAFSRVVWECHYLKQIDL